MVWLKLYVVITGLLLLVMISLGEFTGVRTNGFLNFEFREGSYYSIYDTNYPVVREEFFRLRWQEKVIKTYDCTLLSGYMRNSFLESSDGDAILSLVGGTYYQDAQLVVRNLDLEFEKDVVITIIRTPIE